MNNARGQNMIEYVLLVVAVLLVCVFFFSSSGPMPALINASLNSMINQVDKLNGEIQLNGL
jgi:uncharacterized membrane-anchored protein